MLSHRQVLRWRENTLQAKSNYYLVFRSRNGYQIFVSFISIFGKGFTVFSEVAGARLFLVKVDQLSCAQLPIVIIL